MADAAQTEFIVTYDVATVLVTVIELATGRARVAIDGGRLDLVWQVLAPRRIALMSLPRLTVQFRFSGLDDPSRKAFMRYFDLYMQRGGG